MTDHGTVAGTAGSGQSSSPARPPGGAVRLVALTKDFDDVPAVRGIDLDIAAGEFFSLLGPSGCGKTTTLRMIAGFEQPSGGQILLDGRDVSRLAPDRRPVNTVFQSYALFPFLTVRENVAFGLRYAGTSRADTRRRTDEALARVRMSEYAGRRPAQLSGGQQQRVALARALVLNPRVLLLDEPLGALDAKLRKTLQLELKALQESVGITFLYVTHDQDEALTMSDRIAVFNQGDIAQLGSPTEVYEHPATPFVAGFVGTSNLLDGQVAEAVLGRPGTWSVRPEKIRVVAADAQVAEGQHAVRGVVREVVYVGMSTRFVVDLAVGGSLSAVQQNTETLSDLSHLRGQDVQLVWDAQHEYQVTG